MIEFEFAGARAPAETELSPFQQWAFSDGRPWTRFYRCADHYLLQFPGLADFQVSLDGARVTGWATPGIAAETVQHLFANQVRPLALSRQGKLVLHASAVAAGAMGLAFVGESGRGKSTLAASFAVQQVRCITDDGLQLEWEGARPVAIPSPPSIRLWEDSRTALVPPGQALDPPLDYTTKRRVIGGGDLPFCLVPMPLACLYFLGAGQSPDVQIQPLAPAEAVRELVRHSFLLDIDEQQMLAQHFESVSRIATSSSQFRLDYPRAYGLLPAVRAAIMRHAESLSAL